MADNITWRDWDDNEVVVFSERHGHTYLLDITGWEVLSTLLAARQPLSLDQLVTQLRQSFTEDTQNSDIIELLQTTLPEFHKTGLAYPSKPRD